MRSCDQSPTNRSVALVVIVPCVKLGIWLVTNFGMLAIAAGTASGCPVESYPLAYCCASLAFHRIAPGASLKVCGRNTVEMTSFQ